MADVQTCVDFSLLSLYPMAADSMRAAVVPAAAPDITRHQQYVAVLRGELMGPASLHRTSKVLLRLRERPQEH